MTILEQHWFRIEQHSLASFIHLGCSIGSSACFYRCESVIEAGHLLNVNFKVVMDGEYYAPLGRMAMRFASHPKL
jgi:hypothetical protein